MIHTTNCPSGTCDDPATTFLCDVCGRECAACCGVAESETCDDCEGKMELEIASLKDELGVEHRVIDTGREKRIQFGISDDLDGSTIADYSAPDYIALRLLDLANLNTTANELRERLECDRAIASSRLDAINRLHAESDELRAQLDAAKKERDGAIREMAKARQRASECLDSAQESNAILYLEAEDRGGQFLRMYNEWSRLKRELESARQTIAQLRQADTVRPGPLVEESLALPQYVRQKQIAAWDEGYDAGTNEANHSGIIEVNPYR